MKAVTEQETKRITIYQHSYTAGIIDVEREITVEVPVWMDTANISEERLQGLIDNAINSGSIPDVQAEWRPCDDDFSLVEDNQITSEVV